MTPLPFVYTVKTSTRARAIRILINSQAEVVVTKPRLVPLFLVTRFLRQKESWVVQALQKMQRAQNTRDQVWYQGQAYKWHYTKGNWQLRWEHGLCQVQAYSEGAAKRKVKENLIKEAKVVIKQQVKKWAKIMEIHYQQIQFKDQKTRWGSCSSKGNLNFNVRLIMTPTACLEYVVIHELAHRRQMNHSAAFWSLVEQFDPLYREHRRWLVRTGNELVWPA